MDYTWAFQGSKVTEVTSRATFGNGLVIQSWASLTPCSSRFWSRALSRLRDRLRQAAGVWRRSGHYMDPDGAI